MSTDQQLVVSLEARIRDFERNFAKANRTASNNWRQIENRGKLAARRVGASFSRMASTSVAALTAAMGVGQLRQYADAWQSAANKIAAAGIETSRVADRQSELADMAIRSRAEFGATVDLYTGLTRSTAELGATQAQVLKATETIGKAFAVGGQSSATAAGAIQQFNQALSAGALRGDELNSVLEGAPPLARLIADEFGVSVGQLKSLGEEGALTADRILTAILNGSGAIESQFAKTNSTIAQSFTNLDTAITRYIGQADQANGASSKIAGAINGLANNMDLAAPIAVSLGAALAGAFVGGPIVGGIAGATTAMLLFADSIRPISGDLATIGDYARVAFDTLSTLSADAANALRQSFAGAADLITASLSTIGVDGGQALEFLLAAVKQTVNSIIGAFAFTADTIKATWNTLGKAMAEAIVASINTAIAAVEKLTNSAIGAVNAITGGINSALGTGIGMIGTVDLGRVENAYSGAGKAAGEAFGSAFDALSRDYVGDAMGAISDVGAAWREEANKRAKERAAAAPQGQATPASNGSLTAPLRNPGAGSSGGGSAGGGGGSSRSRSDDLEREIAAIQARTRALDAERAAIGLSATEAAKAEAAFRLLEAAKAAGIPVTDQLRGKIDQLATAYAASTVALDQAEQRQQQIRDMGQQFADTLSSAFTDAIVNGERLDQVLQKLLRSLASQILNQAFSTIFSGVFSGIPGFATGGEVRGPGTGRSDSIVARLSDGEHVINARAAAKHRPLLDAINADRLPRFADGGAVGSPRLAAPGANSSAVTIAPVVNVNATGGTPDQNADLAKQTSNAVETSVRKIVCDELIRQRRPGGLYGV